MASKWNIFHPVKGTRAAALKSRSMLKSHRKKIGFIGLTGTGKTNLIVSIINHLQNGEFDDYSITKAEKNLDSTFPYEQYRRGLTEGVWPAKTYTVSKYMLSVSRKESESNKNEHIDFEFIDIPGERVIDLTMHDRNYSDWSRSILHMLDEAYDESRLESDMTSKKHPPVAKFLQMKREALVAPETFDYDSYARAYKLMMIYFRQHRVLSICPSSILLTPDGKEINTDEFTDDMADQVNCGVYGPDDERYSLIGGQLVPIPSEVLTLSKYSALRKSITNHYKAYVKQYVTPYFNEISVMDTLYFCVDIAKILANGVESKNQQSEMLTQVMKCLSPRNKYWFNNYLTSYLPLAKKISCKKITFVATKADRIHEEYREDDRVEMLLKKFTMFIERETGLESRSVAVKHCHVAAVDSIEHRINRGNCESLFYDADQGTSEWYEAYNPIDEDLYDDDEDNWDWKESWEPGDYYFPLSAPGYPKDIKKPPAEISLKSDIINDLLEVKYLY